MTTLTIAAELRRIVLAVEKSCAYDDSRPVLAGIYARVEGNRLTLVPAGDFRLHGLRHAFRRRDRPDGLDVLLDHEEVRRREVAAGDGVADHRGDASLRFGEPLARLGIALRRLLAPLGGQDLRLLLAFGAQDLGLAQAFGLEHRGALLALRLHLPRHHPRDSFLHGPLAGGHLYCLKSPLRS